MASSQVLLSRPRPRTSWSAVLTTVALLATLAPAPVLAAPSDDSHEQARAAYDEGEKNYRLGRFDEAAVAFEEAYALSDFPEILYNIGLSHLRWYDVDPDVAHLRKAKVVFQNYVLEIQKNPDLGDLEEAEGLIAQIDEKIAAHEKAEADAESSSTVPSGPAEPVDPGSDPGKTLRLGGAIAMGVGGALIVAGAVSGVVLGVRGQEFEGDLANAYNQYEEEGCSSGDVRPECDEINDAITTYRDNGQLANALAVGLGLSLGGIGVIGVVTGAVLFVQGNKKSAKWEERTGGLSIAPMWTRHSTGLSISGRF